MIKKQHYTAPGADILELRVEGQILTLSNVSTLGVVGWEDDGEPLAF